MPVDEQGNPIQESAPLRTSDVHEWVDLSEAQLEPESYVVKGARLIKAGWSLNERYYPDDVLAKSAAVWEGANAYADHPSKEDMKNRPERSVRDIVGYYTAPRHESGKTVADFKVLGEARNWLWPLIQETIETGVPVVGLSINALGSGRKGEAEGKKGLVIEAITHANSVDVVTRPAAGGGFTLLTASDDGWARAVIASLGKEELREARPDLVEEFKREWITTRDSQAIKEARAEADTKSAQLAALTEEHRTTKDALAEALDTIVALRKEQTVDRLLMRLPEGVRGDLRAKLLAAEGAAAMQEVIDTALATLAAVRLPVRVHGAGRAASPQQAAETAPRRNPITEALGIAPAAVEAETLDAFLETRNRK